MHHGRHSKTTFTVLLNDYGEIASTALALMVEVKLANNSKPMLLNHSSISSLLLF
jgi:hypothetical protein